MLHNIVLAFATLHCESALCRHASPPPSATSGTHLLELITEPGVALLVVYSSCKHIAGGKRLHSAGSSARGSVMTQTGGGWEVGFPGGSDVKESSSNVGDLGSIPGLGRSPGGGHGNLLQYSCLENPTDRGAWWVILHGVVKSLTD